MRPRSVAESPFSSNCVQQGSDAVGPGAKRRYPVANTDRVAMDYFCGKRAILIHDRPLGGMASRELVRHAAIRLGRPEGGSESPRPRPRTHRHMSMCLDAILRVPLHQGSSGADVARMHLRSAKMGPLQRPDHPDAKYRTKFDHQNVRFVKMTDGGLRNWKKTRDALVKKVIFLLPNACSCDRTGLACSARLDPRCAPANPMHDSVSPTPENGARETCRLLEVIE